MSNKVLFIVAPTQYLPSGGIQTQVRRTQVELEKRGYEIELFSRTKAYRASDYLCGHVWRAGLETYMDTLSLANQGIPFALSTIFLRGTLSRISRLQYRYVHNLLERNPFHLVNDTLCARKQAQLCGAALPNTQFEAEYCYETIRLDPKKTTVIPNGVDTDWLVEEQNHRKDQTLFDQPFVLCVGRIDDPRKNFDLVVQACLKLKIRCVLVGSLNGNSKRGPGKKIQQAVDANSELIKYLGVIPHGSPELAELFQKCTVLALPSDFETPGLAALEAGFCGSKIIITPVGGTREYFQDDVEYVQPKKIRPLELAIIKCIDQTQSTDLSRRIGRDYTWANVARLTAEVYESFR